MLLFLEKIKIYIEKDIIEEHQIILKNKLFYILQIIDYYQYKYLSCWSSLVGLESVGTAIPWQTLLFILLGIHLGYRKLTFKQASGIYLLLSIQDLKTNNHLPLIIHYIVFSLAYLATVDNV